jgi:hypothetical protein
MMTDRGKPKYMGGRKVASISLCPFEIPYRLFWD